MTEDPDGTVPDGPAEDVTAAFVGHRELLFSIVYNLLGSVADTEDVLQETWLSWARRSAGPAEPVERPRPYLVRIAVNHALARQATISRRRETYIGPWLPDPIVTSDVPDAAGPARPAGLAGPAGPAGFGDVAGLVDVADGADAVQRAESVSLALMVVLETLTPLERAVFVLHEVFGYAHPEIAGILDRSPSAVRQLAHRAREHVQARRPRYRSDPRLRREVTERFLTAVRGGDLQALLRILAPDVVLWADGGGKARAAGLRPLHGRERVARVIAASSRRGIAGFNVRYRGVNGDPSVLLFSGDAPFAVIVLELTPDRGQVSGVYAVTNPDKLTRVH